MIEFAFQEGILSYWCFSIDGHPYIKVRTVVGSRSSIREALQKSEGQSDEERLSSALLLLARSYSLKLLSRQAYHSSSLLVKMKQAGLPKEACAGAIQFCKEKGYLDDEMFLQSKIRSLKGAGKSQKEIAFRVKKMGVSYCDSGGDKEALLLCLSKKYPKWKILLKDQKNKRKLIGALLRRGFSSELIWSVLESHAPSSICPS